MTKAKIYIAVGVAVLLLFMLGTINILRVKLKEEKAEKELYIRNTNNLLDTVQIYQTKDRLNVASVGKLELKLSEYEQYRYEDKALIETLKIDKKKLESITTTQTQTIHTLKGTVRDSIVYRDNYIVDTLRCITINEKWFNLSGCTNKQNEFAGQFESRDSLAIVNHIKQKRFLGFLWYCGKKDSRVDVVSKNPSTKIQGVEYIEIRE